MIIEKYSGSGNDFLIAHKIIASHSQLSALAQKLCHRQLGIGADGMVIIRPHPKYAYEWIFFNADGSQANVCGNASLCVAHYVYRHKLAKKHHVFFTGDRAIEVKIKNSDRVFCNLGSYSSIRTFDQESDYSHNAYLIDMGVPHLVIFTDDESKLPTAANSELRNLRMQYNANINIVFIEDKSTLKVHTYERGVEDITLACGTGMAASSIVSNIYFKTSKNPQCIPPSQDLLQFFIQDHNIAFEGKVSLISKCTIPERFLQQENLCLGSRE